MLHSVLSTTGLLTLIEGHRTEPIMKEDNTHGFSTRKIILVPRVEYEKSIDSMSSEPIVERVVLEEDDAFHYIHDNDRLFSLVYIMFSKTLHHIISIRNQKLRIGIESYRDMITYIFGQRQQDVKFARKALENYQINVIRMASITSFPETSSSSEYCLYQNTIQNQSQTKLSQYQA